MKPSKIDVEISPDTGNKTTFRCTPGDQRHTVLRQQSGRGELEIVAETPVPDALPAGVTR